MPWSIDVCRTCGRVAVWPGCEHWQSEAGWCVSIPVRPADKRGRELEELQREAQKKRGTFRDT